MYEVSVIIPNYNGKAYLAKVLKSLKKQTFPDFETILVDNGSTDGSIAYVEKAHPKTRIISLPENFGFSRAVNEGIRASASPYVILLNNDTEADPGFVEQLVLAIRRHPKAFSCQARMLQMKERDRLDGAGDLYCAFGWAYARGKGRPAVAYAREEKVFSCCAGAAVYRRDLLMELGLFDEEHFAYLEDMDIGYRARIAGYENWYAPEALVCHLGSGTSGSRYNQFKVRYSSRNNLYMIRKNMPLLQAIVNLPFLAAGFGIKLVYFTAKGFGREYLAGMKNGLELPLRGRHIAFRLSQTGCYVKIQLELWKNMFRIPR